MKTGKKFLIYMVLCVTLIFTGIGSCAAISFHKGKEIAQSQVNKMKNNNFTSNQQANTEDMLIDDDGRKVEEKQNTTTIHEFLNDGVKQ